MVWPECRTLWVQDFLAERGYADLTNAGGPAGP